LAVLEDGRDIGGGIMDDKKILGASVFCYVMAIIVFIFLITCSGCRQPDCVTSHGLEVFNSEMEGKYDTTCEALDPWIQCYVDMLPGLVEDTGVTRLCLISTFVAQSFSVHFYPYFPEYKGGYYAGLYWGYYAEVAMDPTVHYVIQDTALYHELMHHALRNCIGTPNDYHHEHAIWKTTVDGVTYATAKYMYAQCEEGMK
jgi:hypothetical protein